MLEARRWGKADGVARRGDLRTANEREVVGVDGDLGRVMGGGRARWSLQNVGSVMEHRESDLRGRGRDDLCELWRFLDGCGWRGTRDRIEGPGPPQHEG